MGDDDLDPARCEECGCRYDRPSRFDCKGHPAPSPELRAAFAVGHELGDRRLGWDSLDDELRDEIDDALAARIAAALHEG